MSKDRGDFWQEINNGLEEVPFITTVAVAPSDPKVLYIGDKRVANRKAMYKSVDGGLSWQPIDILYPPSVIAIDPHSPQTVYIIINRCYPPFVSFKTEDGGETWKGYSIPIPGDIQKSPAVRWILH